jgi:hypothetical protein
VIRPRHKRTPPWSRIRIIDPETGVTRPPGEKGLVVHYDLANRGSCLAVLAEDSGYAMPSDVAEQPGFVLLGRAEGAEARGCSLALDEMLEANRS